MTCHRMTVRHRTALLGKSLEVGACMEPREIRMELVVFEYDEGLDY